MSKKLLHVTGFGRVHQLICENRANEARELLKALQHEYIGLVEENEALKNQIIEVAEVLDMAECMEFDGQKYWLTDELRHKGPYCQLCYDRDGLLMRLQKAAAPLEVPVLRQRVRGRQNHEGHHGAAQLPHRRAPAAHPALWK
jgi:hypothetical protein